MKLNLAEAVLLAMLILRRMDHRTQQSLILLTLAIGYIITIVTHIR